jgi:hypothetical protein
MVVVFSGWNFGGFIKTLAEKVIGSLQWAFTFDLADHEWHTQSLMLTADQCPFIWLMGGTWIEAVRRSAASVPTWFTGVWDWPQEGDSSCGTPSPLSWIHCFCCPGASPNCIHVGPQWNTLSYWSTAIFMSRLVLSFQVKHLCLSVILWKLIDSV